MSWRSWRSWWALVMALAVTGCADSPGDTAGASVPATVVTTTGTAPVSPAATPTVPGSPRTGVTAATRPPQPTRPTQPINDGVAPEGFDRVAAHVTAADGTVCELCVWVAATAEQRARGLMGVTDLSGADGMLFRWDEPTSGSFWMRDTPLPLSIAFFAADGSFVSAADMAPCLDPVPDAECARYAAAGPYTHAIEVAAGDLPSSGIGPGSRLAVSGAPCDPGAG